MRWIAWLRVGLLLASLAAATWALARLVTWPEDPAKALAAEIASAPTEEARRERLSRVGPDRMKAELVEALLSEARRAGQQNDPARALDTYRLAYDAAERLSDLKAMAAAKTGMGAIHRRQGDPGKARENLEQALALAERSQDSGARASALSHLGDLLYFQGNLDEAQAKLEKSLALDQLEKNAGNRQRMAPTLNRLGLIYTMRGETERALACFKRSLLFYRLLGDKVGMAAALSNQGQFYGSGGDLGKALEHFEASLALQRSAGNRSGIAVALHSIGEVYWHRSDLRLALSHYRQALELAEVLGDERVMAAELCSIGAVQFAQGDYPAALRDLRAGLTLAEKLQDKYWIANSLAYLGVVHSAQGDFSESLRYALQALEHFEALGDTSSLSEQLVNVGIVYYHQGDYPQARQYFEKSLALNQSAGDDRGASVSWMALGKVAFSEDLFGEALEAFGKSLALAEAAGLGDETAEALDSIGGVYLERGNYPAALERFEKALSLAHRLGLPERIAESEMKLARAHRQLGDPARALAHAERAADIARRIGLPEVLWQTRTQAGRVLVALGRATESRQAFQEAIATIEAVRPQVAGGVEEAQIFFESRLSPYHAMVEALVSENRVEEALGYAERAKARTLLDVLGGAPLRLTRAMTPAEVEEERRWDGQLASLNRQLSEERQKPDPEAERLAHLDSRMEQVRRDYAAFKTRLYVSHPELRVGRGEVRPLALKEAALLLPDSRTALVEFTVADEKTFLFVLSRPGGSSEPELRAHVLPLSGQDLARRAAEFRRRLSARDLGFRSEARDLYRLLLEPAAEALRGKEQIVIIPDGALWEVPFQALLASESRYLLEDSAISYAPSLAALREQMRLRSGRRPERPSVLAMGNPSLGGETPARARLTFRDLTLEPLPDAEEEVRELAKLYDPERSRTYVGAEAREDRFKAEAPRHQVIHLATHGALVDRSPMHSYLVLSRGATDGGEDGLLEAREIAELDLEADLAVLAGCETARGRIGAGEGVIGLTWGFFAAGVPATVVSQWAVESKTTARLMRDLHRALADGRGKPGSLSKGEALRAASLRLLRESRSRHPFYWAGFVVVGDGISR